MNFMVILTIIFHIPTQFHYQIEFHFNLLLLFIQKKEKMVNLQKFFNIFQLS